MKIDTSSMLNGMLVGGLIAALGSAFYLWGKIRVTEEKVAQLEMYKTSSEKLIKENAGIANFIKGKLVQQVRALEEKTKHYDGQVAALEEKTKIYGNQIKALEMAQEQGTSFGSPDRGKAIGNPTRSGGGVGSLHQE